MFLHPNDTYVSHVIQIMRYESKGNMFPFSTQNSELRI